MAVWICRCDYGSANILNNILPGPIKYGNSHKVLDYLPYSEIPIKIIMMLMIEKREK